MSPFDKTSDSGTSEEKPDDWLLAQGERDGFPMIVRMATAYRGLAPLPGYDHHLIISVHLRNPRPNGFPSDEEGDDLEMLERDVCGRLEVGNDCVCVLVITNNGLRDFIFYTRDVQSTKARIEDSRKAFAGFKSEFFIEPDKKWEIYKAFGRMLSRPN